MLYPGSHTGADDPYSPTKPGAGGRGTRYDGKVVLTLPTARKLSGLRVEIISKCNLAIAGRYTTDTIMQLVHNIETLPEMQAGSDPLAAGEHVFPFSILVPASAPTYTRTPHGRVYTRIRAIAPGCGRLGTDLVVEEELFIAANSSSPEMPSIPAPYTFSSESFSEYLGPVRVQLTSRYLLVAGYLALSVSLPCLAAGAYIDEITLELVQDFTLRRHVAGEDGSVRFVGQDSGPLRQRVNVWSSKGASADAAGSLGNRGIKLGKGGKYDLVQQIRLPGDGAISATTHGHTRTPINAQHLFSIKISYAQLSDNDGHKGYVRTYAITAPGVTLSSTGHNLNGGLGQCCCLIETLQLPAYTPTSSSTHRVLPPSFDLTDIGLCYSCLCKVADLRPTVQLYGVTEDEIAMARESESRRRSSWKDDDEYGRDALGTGVHSTLPLPDGSGG